MTTTANMGWARKVGISASGAATYQLEFETCDISKRGTHIDPQGIRGSVDHISENVAEGPYAVGGTLNLGAHGGKPDVLTQLLPWIMGNTFSGTVLAIGDTLTDRDMDLDWGSIGVPRAAACRIDSATFSSQSGGNLMLSLQIEGKTWTLNAASSFPGIGSTLSNLQPYVHHQGTFTINSIACPLNSWSMTIANNLVKDRFNASTTRTELPMSDRVVTIDIDAPFTSDIVSLYDLTVSGVAANFTFTNGSRSIIFALANIKCPAQPVQIQRNIELGLRNPFKAYRTSATALLTATNDDT